MGIEHLQTILFYPNKSVAEPRLIGGTNVLLEGAVFSLLEGVHEKSKRDCSINIAFNQPAEDVASNPCRSLLVAYAQAPSAGPGFPSRRA